MPGELKDLIEKVVTSDPVARKVARAQKLDQRLGELATGPVPANRITAGTIVAQTITLGTGGMLSGGGGRFDDTGFSLASQFGAVTGTMRPSNTSADWFTGPLGMNMGGSGAGAQQRFAGLAFFSYTTGSPRRGGILQADGVKSALPAEDQKGQVIIRATDGQNLTPGTAQETAEIILDAGNSPGNPGTIIMDGIVKPEHDLIMPAATWMQAQDLTVIGFFTASGGVDLAAADYIDAAGVRIQGGYSTTGITLNTNAWSYASSTLPVIQLRRIGNFVFMSGRCQAARGAGTVNNDSHFIITNTNPLPTDYRPTNFKYLTIPRQTASVYDGQTRVVVESGGALHLAATAANEISNGQDISFDGAYYSID